MEHDAAVRRIRGLLVDQAGGYLRNIRWYDEETCHYCAGDPGAGIPFCPRCESYAGRSDLADRVGFLTYAWPQDQTGRLMWGYKNEPPAPASVDTVQMAITYALNRHRDCFEDYRFGGRPAFWATVPSLSQRRAGVHPLRSLLASTMIRLTEVPVSAADVVSDPRRLQPANLFVGPLAAGQTLNGAAVLLLDDTWAGGGHVQSTAAALKLAGASHVTVLVMARWLSPEYSVKAKAFIDTRLKADFDPDVCPFDTCISA